MKTTIIKPGFLVSLKTSLRGGVNYARDIIESEHTDENGARVAAWKTRREIPDPAEYEAAAVVRNKARTLVTGVCSASSFGLLCPLDKTDELSTAVAEARSIAADFNAGARLAHVDVYVIAGRIAQDDAEAARAIASELRTLLDDMQAGIAAADPAAIREAANKARAVGAMLEPAIQERVTAAIAEARSAARAIVKRVEKAGETAAAVVADCRTAAIESARFAFLDTDAPAAVTTEAPAARGLDLEPPSIDDGTGEGRIEMPEAADMYSVTRAQETAGAPAALQLEF